MDDKWLNLQFKNFPDKSKSDLSQLLGIQPSGISKMLAGTRQIKAKEYLLMRKFFDMPGSGAAIEKRKSNIQSYENLKAADGSIQAWTGTPSRYKVVEVTDSNLMPDFLPGERVLIDTSENNALRSGLFAMQDSGRFTIRILEISGTKLKISGIAKESNRKTVPASTVQIIGRVVAKLNWI